MNTYHSAYIGLGSNLENPQAQITSALDALKQLPMSRQLRCSSYYSSKAIGPGEQPDYINAAVAIETQLEPLALLRQLQTIENDHGRQRDIRWGARTLDLDLLVYDGLSMDTQELQLPHPEIANRNFVLYPLYDLQPLLCLPDGQSLQALLEKTSTDGLERINLDLGEV